MRKSHIKVLPNRKEIDKEDLQETKKRDILLQKPYPHFNRLQPVTIF